VTGHWPFFFITCLSLIQYIYTYGEGRARQMFKQSCLVSVYILIISLIGFGCSIPFVDLDQSKDELVEQLKDHEQTFPSENAEEAVKDDNGISDEDLSISDNNDEKRLTKGEEITPEIKGAVDDNDYLTNLLDPLILVNKSRALPRGYIPPDLIEPYIPFAFEENLPKRLMREEAALALELLFAKALADGIELLGQSAYRSYETQEAIFAYNARLHGEEEANKLSALPGQSEHQTGLAIDVTSRSVGLGLDKSFGETPEGVWLQENADKYGFIIRYPKDKENITGYIYEPWHIRYVGIDVAKEIYENDLTLEDFLEQLLMEQSSVD
jgi:D-alanyl-D-alanine carboxypeptidase